MTDARLVRWRSWVDKGAIPPGWRKNLWDEFYAMLHRRESWRGYREMLLASPEDVQYTARWLTQVVLRNHIEGQALAIRRFSDSRSDPRIVSFGRILAEIAEAPDVFDQTTSDEARADLAELHRLSEGIRVFADKEVAHLDRDHATAIPRSQHRRLRRGARPGRRALVSVVRPDHGGFSGGDPAGRVVVVGGPPARVHR